jgi:hypothetical protein
MKSFLLTFTLATICTIASTQPLPRDLESTWNLQENNEKIIEINYTLNRVDDNRYYKVIVRAFVDDRPIQM